MLADKVFSGKPISDLLRYVDSWSDDQSKEEAVILFDVAIEKLKEEGPSPKAMRIVEVFGDKMPEDKMSLMRLLTMI